MTQCTFPHHADMEWRLARIDRRIDACWATAALVTGLMGTGVLGTALYQYGMAKDGPMTTAGAALATALYGGTGWIARRAGRRKRSRAALRDRNRLGERGAAAR